MTINIQYFKTAYGELILGAYNNQLIMCDWRYRKMRAQIDKRLTTQLNSAYHEDIDQTDEVLNLTRNQLNAYFNNERKQFDLPLLLLGSDFQKSVWQALINIPYGQTASYLALANKINNPKAVRAVANANGANAISIIVPCHRIIGSNGALTGYAGGLPTKRKLLALEQSLFA